MAYDQFAYVYDRLMSDVPYDEWMSYLLHQKKTFKVDGMKLLDVGCGTGEWTVKASAAGFETTGIDLSESMLAMAQQKAMEANQSIRYFQMDMSEAEDLGQFDCITIFCDSLNYLETEEAVQQTFRKMYDLLSADGLFMFDVHSVYKVNELFAGQTYSYDDGEAAYIWNSFEGEYENSAEHELTFFIREDGDLYSRFDEFHKQRTFPVEQYKTWLYEAGFKVESVTADFTGEEPAENSERIFFTCTKR
ncbi:class I SAM-dependent DNA methyltransferase [Jeotgalibacillus haloalkalitolerans]|uniref:Class I SAM-dependent methyltransferase n=1 Tax=Jeotgalibacillus haloalkalitolerans TaxID=3104292 RepID=A0ABU5KNN4_9BACL|nr:class I SAM-dependent methyltransferase [Jeotgalibacillus sp. HH7-29]MDZ5712290.1 class I SAM-dependent methyltransferase [Jeotgalibacillus sp. HH7-29]